MRAICARSMNASETVVSSLIEEAPLGICVVDSELRFVAVNHQARSVFGNIGSILGRGVSEILQLSWPAPFAAQALECFRHTLETGERYVAPTVTEERKNVAQVETYDWQLQRVTLADASFGVICYFRNLTEICRAQAEATRAREALEEREERLRDADRRKDEFLAMLAHELRNPLAPIRTGLELIRLTGEVPDKIERVRSMMERQVGHMVRLIDDLLDVSRITSGKIRLQRVPTHLQAMVNTALEANRGALNEAQVALSVELPHAPVVLDVDPTRFVQIVSNLLHNAVKFTNPQGQIKIAAGLQRPSAAADPELWLSVSDSGIGISADMLPRVFDLFTQGDTSRTGSQKGLGIGLALARRLIEMHDGTIEAASEGVGLGSTFTLRLPASATIVEQAQTSSLHVAPVKRKVVVIDDNKDSADVTAEFVSALGGESKVAYDGENGISLVLAFRPEVVLLDIGMPGIDGYETCRRIRKALGRGIKLIAMTGWGQERDKQEAKSAGFDAHLTKPVDPAMLKGLLAEAAPAA
jgi:signal transduction histidine kinase/ActR/RegA family two-component response regulator